MDPIDVIIQTISAKGLKKKYIAEMCGFTPQQFSDLLSNRRKLKQNDIVPLCNALGITPNELYGYL